MKKKVSNLDQIIFGLEFVYESSNIIARLFKRIIDIQKLLNNFVVINAFAIRWIISKNFKVFFLKSKHGNLSEYTSIYSSKVLSVMLRIFSFLY